MFYSQKLKKLKKVDHCFFSRRGGYSKGIYKGLNCGRGSKDSRINIKRNLNFISRKMGVERQKLILMYQTHSNRVIEIKKNNYKKKIFSDAIITRLNGIVLGVVTADCVPILVWDSKTKIIGCIHAGWKGALSNIIKKTIQKIKKINPKSIIYACIGPCIGRKSYEVDLKFFKKFISRSKKNKKYFTRKSEYKKYFDLRKFVADKFKELNVNVDHVIRDTFKEKNNFFSYRRSSIHNQTDYGRCISVIKLL